MIRSAGIGFSGIRSSRVVLFSLLVILGFAAQGREARAQERWTEERANAWYAQQPWPVGADFLPSTAINELEMWQADTYDPATIDRELGWAQGIGMNTMRVFLHNLCGSRMRRDFRSGWMIF